MRSNAIAGRWIASARRECLDRMQIVCVITGDALVCANTMDGRAPNAASVRPDQRGRHDGPAREELPSTV
jgi:hypothetical protein